MVRRDAPGRPGAAPGGDAPRGDAGDAGDEPETGGDVRCKLLRGDGSEWTVTDLGLEADGLRVSAYRYVREGHAASQVRRETLEDELLTPRDRVWCHDRRGAVIWDMSHPGADAYPGADARPGAGAHSGAETPPGTDARPRGRDGDGDVG